MREHKDVLPLDFILGFYVTQVLLIQSTVADVVLQKYYQEKVLQGVVFYLDLIFRLSAVGGASLPLCTG